MSRQLAYIVVAICCLVVACIALEATASLTLTSGLVMSRPNNLVVNGSFEIGAPPDGFANALPWANPLSPGYTVPPAWNSTGPNSVAMWGNDSGGPNYRLRSSDILPDGRAGLDMKTSTNSTVNMPPTFNPNATVSFPGTPTFSNIAGGPVTVNQSVPVQLTPAPSYSLTFWVSGEENATNQGNIDPGILGLLVTNVLPGNPIQWLAVPNSIAYGQSHLFEYNFTPINPLAPVNIGFINWGGMDYTPFGGTAFGVQPIIDDVIVNAPEPASAGMLCFGCVALASRRRKRRVNRAVVAALGAVLAAGIVSNQAQASLTLTTGLGTTTTGNLVTNGSFENGSSVPTPGFGGKLYWASGTSNTPFGVPTAWTTSGGPNNYALWGNDGSAAVGNNGSDALPDGQFALYFGNGAPTFVNQAPTFNNNGTVSFSSTPTITQPAFYTPQVILQQTVPTNTNPSPFYRFSFWVSGEDAGPSAPSPAFGERGIFGLRVTNVLAGDPMQWLTVPNGGTNPLGASHLFEYTFVPLNTSLPVTIEFHNFGHFDLSAYGMANFTTELVLDDVRLNLAPEPGAAALLIAGCAALGFRRSSRSRGKSRTAAATAGALAVAAVGGAQAAQASLTLTTGLGTTQAGNLVVNGSFENGAPAPTPGPAGALYWGTGTGNTPFSVPTGWTSSGGVNNYASWGNDGSAPQGLAFSGPIPDGNYALYFGNGTPATVSQAPTFNNDGTVTFGSPPTFAPAANYTPEVVLSQTVPTNTNPSPFYRYSFWASGENAQSAPAGDTRGIFGMRITNVLAGDPMQWLTVPNNSAPLGISHTYEYTFVPLNTSLPVTIEFYNYGHLTMQPFGGTPFTTELVLDNVIINTSVPEPASLTLLGAGALLVARRHRREAARPRDQ